MFFRFVPRGEPAGTELELFFGRFKTVESIKRQSISKRFQS